MSAPIAIDLPPEAVAALRSRARTEQMSPATLAHKLLVEALLPNIQASRMLARAEGKDDRLILDRFRDLLAVDLAEAEAWDDLQARLAAHGYTFCERDGALALYCTATAAHICMASDLGWPYSDLLEKFGAPFPNSTGSNLARRVLHRANAGDHPDLFPELIEDEGEVILIEDE